MGKGRYGRRLFIPQIYEYSNAQLYATTRYGAEKKKHCNTMIPLLPRAIFGRPVPLLKKLIDFGFEKGYFDKQLVEQVIEHGFDRYYWGDTGILAKPFKYFIFEKESKKKRLEELEKELTEGEENGKGQF